MKKLFVLLLSVILEAKSALEYNVTQSGERCSFNPNQDLSTKYCGFFGGLKIDPYDAFANSSSNLQNNSWPFELSR